jgi:hypothetical protein
MLGGSWDINLAKFHGEFSSSESATNNALLREKMRLKFASASTHSCKIHHSKRFFRVKTIVSVVVREEDKSKHGISPIYFSVRVKSPLIALELSVTES